MELHLVPNVKINAELIASAKLGIGTSYQPFQQLVAI